MRIVREQTYELLKHLREEQPASWKSMTLPELMTANCLRAQAEVQRAGWPALPLDDSGVRSLDRILSAMHEVMSPHRFLAWPVRRISSPDAVLIADSFGAILGEALRQRLGGAWRWQRFSGKLMPALDLEDRGWTLPTHKAGKHFSNGDDDSVWSYYQKTVERCLPGQRRLSEVGEEI